MVRAKLRTNHSRYRSGEDRVRIYLHIWTSMVTRAGRLRCPVRMCSFQTNYRTRTIFSACNHTPLISALLKGDTYDKLVCRCEPWSICCRWQWIGCWNYWTAASSLWLVHDGQQEDYSWKKERLAGEQELLCIRIQIAVITASGQSVFVHVVHRSCLCFIEREAMHNVLVYFKAIPVGRISDGARGNPRSTDLLL